MNRTIDFAGILEVLHREDVEFILVGGVAAIVSGAPVSTFDLDILFLNDEPNRDRLLQALTSLDAIYLDPAGRRIAPTLSHLEKMKLHRLRTRFGVLDVMTQIGSGRTYSDLFNRTRLIRLSGDLTIRTLELAAVVESKVEAGRPKDLAVLPVLKRTIELQQDED